VTQYAQCRYLPGALCSSCSGRHLVLH
jgi:hypothetical protein